MSTAAGLYQCPNCCGPSDGPGWCAACRAGELTDDEVSARVAAARADIGGILERHLDNETGLQRLVDAGYGDMT